MLNKNNIELTTQSNVHPSLHASNFKLSKIAEEYLEYTDVLGDVETLLDSFKWTPALLDRYKKDLLHHAKPGHWATYNLDSESIAITKTCPSFNSAVIFDTETFVKGDSAEIGYPIIATALSSNQLAIWLHQSWDGITDYTPIFITLPDYSTIIAHNAGFDSSRVSNKFFNNPKINVLCTQGMMNLLHGAAEEVRWCLGLRESHPLYKTRKGFITAVNRLASELSLKASYEFLTKTKLPDDLKDIRKVFVKAKSFQEFIDNQDALLDYALGDVLIGFEVFKRLYDALYNQTGNYTQIASMNIVGRSVLPVMTNRQEWLNKAHERANQNIESIYDTLEPYVNQIYSEYLEDPSVAEKLPILKWASATKKNPIPKWVLEFKKRTFSIKGEGVQELLQLEYRPEGSDIWYKIMRSKNNKETGEKSIGLYYETATGKQRIPHIDNSDENVGTMLSSEFLDLVEDYKGDPLENPRMRSKLFNYDIAPLHKLLRTIDANSMHTGFQGRVERQIISNQVTSCEVLVGGTVSGRNKDSFFLTMPSRCKHPKDKVMFSLKSTHQAPPGMTFISFDFSGQELTVSGIYADAYIGKDIGSSALFKSILVGDKKEGTDPHSMLGKRAGVSRDQAKSAIYGMTYGCGAKKLSETVGVPLEVSKSIVSNYKGSKDDLGNFTGGIASEYFNYSYRNISESKPLPVLGVPPNASLSPKLHSTNQIPAQLNFRIQATCGLKGMMTGWLLYFWKELREAGMLNQCFFQVGIHDEYHYLCPDDLETTEKIARLMYKAHHAVWRDVFQSCGLEGIPIIISHRELVVDVSKVLRKEANKKVYDATYEYTELGYQYHFDMGTRDIRRVTFK